MRPLARVTGFVLDATDAAEIARRLRHLKNSEIEDVSPALLRRSAVQLRAAAYSLKTAASRFDHRADLLEHDRQQAERPVDPEPDSRQDAPQ